MCPAIAAISELKLSSNYSSIVDLVGQDYWSCSSSPESRRLPRHPHDAYGDKPMEPFLFVLVELESHLRWAM
jgi:hypothetical protein